MSFASCPFAQLFWTRVPRAVGHAWKGYRHVRCLSPGRHRVSLKWRQPHLPPCLGTTSTRLDVSQVLCGPDGEVLVAWLLPCRLSYSAPRDHCPGGLFSWDPPDRSPQMSSWSISGRALTPSTASHSRSSRRCRTPSLLLLEYEAVCPVWYMAPGYYLTTQYSVRHWTYNTTLRMHALPGHSAAWTHCCAQIRVPGYADTATAHLAHGRCRSSMQKPEIPPALTLAHRHGRGQGPLLSTAEPKAGNRTDGATTPGGAPVLQVPGNFSILEDLQSV